MAIVNSVRKNYSSCLNRAKNSDSNTQSYKDDSVRSNHNGFYKPPRILLVEDVPVLQTINMEFLKMIGCKVDLARDGEEALRMAENQYDLILLDVGLPIIDGFMVAQEIRKKEKFIKSAPNILIALTSFGSVICKKCFDAGFDDFYVKPLSLEMLAAVIKRWLPKHAKSNDQII